MGLIYFWNGGANSSGGFDSLWLYNCLLSLWYQNNSTSYYYSACNMPLDKLSLACGVILFC